LCCASPCTIATPRSGTRPSRSFAEPAPRPRPAAPPARRWPVSVRPWARSSTSPGVPTRSAWPSTSGWTFRAGTSCLGRLPRSADTIRLAIDLRLDLQSGYVLLGELPRMLASLREAESRAQAVGDERRPGRGWAHMVSSLWWMGQLESAVDYVQRALAIATDLGDRSLEILARARLGMAYLYLGEHRLVIDVV